MAVTSYGVGGFIVLWFYVGELPKAKPAVVLIKNISEDRAKYGVSSNRQVEPGIYNLGTPGYKVSDLSLHHVGSMYGNNYWLQNGGIFSMHNRFSSFHFAVDIILASFLANDPVLSLWLMKKVVSLDIEVTCLVGRFLIYQGTRVIFYVRRIRLYFYKYRIYGAITIYILKGLAPVYHLI